MANIQEPKTFAFVGTYTKTNSEGIYVYTLDTTSGSLRYVNKIDGLSNPSFLAVHPTKKYLFATREPDTSDEEGAVLSFSFDQETGTLTFLNEQPSMGTSSCHMDVDRTGKYLLASNYGSGSVAVFPINPDGTLGDKSDFIQHTGSSVHPRRQKGPHAHSITVAPSNRFAYAADLGIDKVLIYEFNAMTGKLTPSAQSSVDVTPGSGPRHFDFHPNNKWAYLINEISATLTAFTYDARNGNLVETQTVSTLPKDYSEIRSCADIHVAPSGRFIYGSNRGHNSIVIYKIDPRTGHLDYVDNVPTEGATPRNFAIDPTGAFLFAANQDSDNIVAFTINSETGGLTPTGDTTAVPMPVCIKIVSIEATRTALTV